MSASSSRVLTENPDEKHQRTVARLAPHVHVGATGPALKEHGLSRRQYSSRNGVTGRSVGCGRREPKRSDPPGSNPHRHQTWKRFPSVPSFRKAPSFAGCRRNERLGRPSRVAFRSGRRLQNKPVTMGRSESIEEGNSRSTLSKSKVQNASPSLGDSGPCSSNRSRVGLLHPRKFTGYRLMLRHRLVQARESAERRPLP